MFFTKKTWFRNDTPFNGLLTSDYTLDGRPVYTYDGPVYAEDPAFGTTDWLLTPADLANMHGRGATAISRCIPTNPVSDAATFIGELKDGLPSIPSKLLFKQGLSARNAGGEWLNLNFGVLPVISDFQNFAKAAVESDKILEQLRRDSGRVVRRRYEFPVEISEEETVTNGVSPYYPPHNPYLLRSKGRKTVTIRTETKYVFSGGFTYHMDLGNDLHSRMNRTAAEARKLYGIRIDPEVLWNLTPWSWAIDWVGNIGDVLHNVSAFSRDGLVMKWGYIQMHKKWTRRVTLEGASFYSRSPAIFQHERGYETKARVAATPFGFGLNTAAFTPRQWSILGALGMTKGPKQL
jgi:hypothetical protein